MDIDQFAQCLNYLQASAAKPTVDKLIPIGGALMGAALGFGLNFLATSRKEAKVNKSKKACCEEDVDELRHISKQCLGSLLELCQIIFEKERPAAHNLPSSLDTPLLDKYYPDIAHSFSVNQRYWLKIVSRMLGDVNVRLESLLAHNEETSLFRISIFATNLEIALLEVYKLCCCIIADKEVEFADGDEELLELGIPKDHVVSLALLKDNAEKGNLLLHLPK